VRSFRRPGVIVCRARGSAIARAGARATPCGKQCRTLSG
jgi:hypothetical protein